VHPSGTHAGGTLEVSQPSSRRYEVRGKLGEGGTGVVYEAYDTKDHTLVALKTIDAHAAESLYRLKHEFRALADVQHRNLIRFGELSCERGQWFFSMELVRGKNFVEYVRPLASRERGSVGHAAATTAIVQTLLPESRCSLPDSGVIATAAGPSLAPGVVVFDEGRLRDALAQLVSALCAVHDAGHVHRDVKPSNVLVTDEGRVVLLDFGLVTALAASPRGEAELVLGTPAFMAPERIEGTAVGPEADWYSVGVMLFLALTGTLPFAAATTRELLKAVVSHDAPAPRELVPAIPADLDDLCVGLLRRNKAERLTGDAIRARLGLVADDAAAAAFGDTAAAFVGREAELGELARAFAEGPGTRIVVLEGEPGMGKTSLATRFLRTLPQPTLVLSGRCYEQESVPFKGVDAMIDDLTGWLMGLSHREVESLVAGGVRYLATVFPVLNRVDAIAEATEQATVVASVSALREQAFGELERLFVALSRRGPLALFLDDLQWADADSVTLLRRIVLQPMASPCLLLITIRTGVELPEDVAGIVEAAPRIALGALSEAESQALADVLLTKRLPPAEASARREFVVREARGHPLFLGELVRSARAAPLRPGAHVDLQDVIWQRIEERDATDRAFLELVALAGAPTPYEVIARAAEMDAAECLVRLGALRAAQLIRVSRHEQERLVAPYHDRVREAVLRHLRTDASPDAIARLHLRLGRALLESTVADALPERIFAIAYHFHGARVLLTDPVERGRVAELYLRASRQAWLATAYGRARELARSGLELLGDSAWSEAYERTRDLSLAEIEATFLAGGQEAAAASFEATRAHVMGQGDRARVYTAWLALLIGRGQFAEAIRVGREALAELSETLPSRGLRARNILLHARTARAHRAIDALLGLPPLEDPRIDGVMRILTCLMPAAYFADAKLFTWIALRAAHLSMDHGVCDVSSYAFVGYGLAISAVFGEREEAAAFGEVALALNERFGNQELAAKIAHINGALITPWVRPLPAAIAQLGTAYELSKKSGDMVYECYAATGQVNILFCESPELAALQAKAEWAREVCARRKVADHVARAEAFRRYALTLRGLTPSVRDLGTAESSDAEFLATLDERSAPTARFYYCLCTAALEYHFGSVARARSLLASTAWWSPLGLVTSLELCFLDALVAAREHDDARDGLRRSALRRRVARCVTRLEAWARSSPANFEAHALIAAAELKRIRGRAAAASECFERAVTAARTRGTVQREALASELAAAHARAIGDAASSDRHTRAAIDAYRRWGANAKVDALRPDR
jgi:predicted ATPase